MQANVKLFQNLEKMKEIKTNDELQSRREFFKRAAKGALPIIAGAVLASNPIIAEAATSSCAGCNNRCMNSCFNTCYNSCSGSCTGANKR